MNGTFLSTLTNWLSHLRRLVTILGFRIVSLILTFFFGILITRTQGETLYGEYAFVLAASNLLATFLSFGMPPQITRELAQASDDKLARLSPIYSITALLIFSQIITIALLCVLSDNSRLLLIVSLSLLFSINMNIHGTLNGLNRVLHASFLQNIALPLGFICTFLLLLHYGPSFSNIAVSGQMAGQLIVMAIALVFLTYFVSARKWIWQILFIKQQSHRFRMALKTGFSLFLSQMVIAASTQIDIIVLSSAVPEALVAQYYAAARGANLVTFGPMALIALTAPLVFREPQGPKSPEAVAIFHSNAVGCFFLAALGTLGLILFGQSYLLLYAPSFLNAYLPMILLAIGYLIWSMFALCPTAIRAARSDSSLLIINLFAVFLNIGVSLVLVNQFGMIGVALGTTLQYIILGLGCHLYCLRRILLRISAFDALIALHGSRKS